MPLFASFSSKKRHSYFCNYWLQKLKISEKTTPSVFDQKISLYLSKIKEYGHYYA